MTAFSWQTPGQPPYNQESSATNGARKGRITKDSRHTADNIVPDALSNVALAIGLVVLGVLLRAEKAHRHRAILCRHLRTDGSNSISMRKIPRAPQLANVPSSRTETSMQCQGLISHSSESARWTTWLASLPVSSMQDIILLSAHSFPLCPARQRATKKKGVLLFS